MDDIKKILEEHMLWRQDGPAAGKRADLRDADLKNADLRDAYLREADLRGANLRGADLRGADLRGAVLRGADLYGADLHGADLRDAALRGVAITYLTQGIHPAPEGDLVGWKRVNNSIVKLLIPKEAKRSCATTRKHRAEYAYVLDITGGNTACTYMCGIVTQYSVGKNVYPDKWDEDRWNECSHGIHFFLTREEALTW